MPDEYRTQVLRFVEMHANSELMGVLPEREWIMRAPTLRRKLALTAKVQDEVGHAQLLYRVAEDLGKTARGDDQDLLDGKTKFHNVFHYPDEVVGRHRDHRVARRRRSDRRPAGAPGLLVRPVRPDDEEDLLGGERSTSCTAATSCVTMVTGTAAQRASIQEALDRWWGPLMQMHGPRSDRAKDRDIHWKIKAKTSEELRQEFLGIYVPRIRELGLTLPDPDLGLDAGDRRVGYARAGLERAPDRRHEPRPEVRGTAAVPP